ncbi:hypothetical protein PBY51_013655 [Eleginops maclovinus]|uniref:Uncharacterized protein n=1 Tax=Eleginops maclovinus TaxID=56733 RepID=A0AAN7Y711_ELEMC|nr:hypothetical protein PBY51_013655 [Eleginops maclovinus]
MELQRRSNLCHSPSPPAQRCSVPRSTPFESVHDILVLSHLRGVDLVSGISGSGDFSHLAVGTRRWIGGRGCHGNRPLGWDTVQASRHTL